MPEIPECLARRYRALDELIGELTSNKSGSNIDCCSDDPGVKLMCNFWNILKENPDCDLTQAVEERMGMTSKSTGYFKPKRVTCYMAGCCRRDGDKDSPKPKNTGCCKSGQSADSKPQSCQRPNSPSSGSDNMPLSKVLCNIKEAASFDKKCQAKVSELLATQKELQEQIGNLEQREKEGIQLLKQADCMWTCMEASYKKKVAESLERQKTLLKQMKEVENSVQKWRKNKKDLEFQMDNIGKCQQEIKEKTTEKNSDLKCITLEIADFSKRIENNKSDIEGTNKSFSSKKNASCAKLAYIANEVTRLEKQLNEEKKRKFDKEQEGSKYIKDARDDLQKLCKVLLQKKLENEDMAAEKEALQLEIEMLLQTCDQCKDKCRNKQQNIEDEIQAINKEIANFKVRCIRCHECTDTVDMRKFCTDCPRCAHERNCLLEGDHCSPDHTMDCVCMTVKQKFLDNVFENMYTILERQTKTCQGKAVADAVLTCLKKSRNGKLNEATKKILQEFILNTVKKNLNLTIVGGAVKTRCEMDQETYKQLMLCLKQIKVTKPDKVDKGTPTKKDPCRRWPSSSECNCPNGPRDCICTTRAPPPPKDPAPCPEDPEDKEEPGEVVMCPHKDSTPCGPDCGMHASRVAADVAAWKPNPCQEPSCQLRNMRAAQCVLGPEALCSNTLSRGFKSSVPIIPSVQSVRKQKSCQCSHTSTKPCGCHKDTKQLKRERVSICDKGMCTIVQFPFSDKKIAFSDSDLLYNIDHIVPVKKPGRISESISSLSFKDHSISDNKKEKPFVKYKQQNSTFENKGAQHKIINKFKNNGTSSDSDDENLTNNILKIVVNDGGKEIICAAPKLSESPSGNITMALEENILKFIDTKTKENADLYMNLKEDSSGFYSINIGCKEGDKNAKKILVKQTSSGNLLLDLKKTIPKKLHSHRCKKHSKAKSSKKIKEESTTKRHRDVVDSCIGTFEISGTSHEHPSISKSELCQATILGLKRAIKEPLILRRTDSGNYDIVLDKEYENWYKDIAKCHECEEDVTCVKFLKTDSDKYVINFDPIPDSKSKKAYLSKTEDGNLKLLIDDKEESHTNLLRQKSSFISSKIFENVLNRQQDSEPKVDEKEQKKYIFQKSCSESNIYNNVRNNLSLDINTATSPKLTRTDSGQYTVVLDKVSRNSFVNNLRKYLCGSTKGYIPIKKNENGDISIALNNDIKSNAQYASFIIKPTGSIYVTLKENMKDDRADISTDFSSHSDVKWDQYIDEVKNPSVKGVSTTCNALKDGSCDINKCVCKHLCFKSKRWVVDDSTSGAGCGVVWKRDNTDKAGYRSAPFNNVCNGGNTINTHIVIKPRNDDISPKNSYNEEFNCYNVCPYHVTRYNKLSNELIEISGLCQTGKAGERQSICEGIAEEQRNIFNRIQRQDRGKERSVRERVEERRNWDSIEHMPHQLPSFLKDFSCAI
ncbi:unnamed protein product [Leptosia nina]|uniref:Uncharacterized protein n=1 Tax=Leptosia nina TaxID=320188 RepID=A0AAV1K3U4_9NEOP